MILNRIYLISLLILLISFGLYGQDCDFCKTYFDTLLIIQNKPKISRLDLQKSWQIASKLYNYRYVDYPEEINGVAYDTHSLSRTYSDICIYSGSQAGVYYYLKYMRLTNGSAEEERAIDFERIFVLYPEIVLKQIGNNEELLDDIVFGFISNRRFGPKNPYENSDYTAETYIENGPKPILTTANCKTIFFETNPSLRTKYNEFKYQIDFIINHSITGLKEEK
jgi:hypothetical protein